MAKCRHCGKTTRKSKNNRNGLCASCSKKEQKWVKEAISFLKAK